MFVLIVKLLLAASTIAGLGLIVQAPADKNPITVSSDPYPGGCPPCTGR